MGRHDPDPKERLRYVMPAVLVLVVAVLVVAGFSVVHFVSG
jgi:hypothetical protein